MCYNVSEIPPLKEWESPLFPIVALSLELDDLSKVSVKARAIEIAAPIVERMGFELVDVEYKNPGGPWNLALFIYKPQGVNIEDCEKVSKELDPIFDADEGLLGRYDFLTVSSPGLDRPFKNTKDFLRHRDEKIELSLYQAIEKQKKMKAVLLDATDERIMVETTSGEMSIDRSNIAKAHVAIEF